MQTNLSPSFKQNSSAAVVEEILRKCVHCGFCNATCPTYQITGDELDGPRGRIYQMKQFFEGEDANQQIRLHLDRCLTCRSCETTCPSGVNYSRLLETGRELIDQALPRPVLDRLLRWGITRFLNSGWLFSVVLRCGQFVSPLLPLSLRNSIPARPVLLIKTASQHKRRVLMLSGCVQPALAPNTNAAAANLLDYFGIATIEIDSQHCCGAVGLHTSQVEQGRQQARKLIDHWWPHVESGVESIIVSATGCGVTVKDYATLFADDPVYAKKAKTIGELSQDLSELIATELQGQSITISNAPRVAFHTPCTMQHGLGLKGNVEQILASVGYQVCQVGDAHLCCGSAGTYSIFQSELSSQLRINKQKALAIDSPTVIATANVGCQLHIAYGSEVPVVHWIELLNDALGVCPT